MKKEGKERMWTNSRKMCFYPYEYKRDKNRLERKAFFFFLYTEKQNVTSERKKDTH